MRRRGGKLEVTSCAWHFGKLPLFTSLRAASTHCKPVAGTAPNHRNLGIHGTGRDDAMWITLQASADVLGRRCRL